MSMIVQLVGASDAQIESLLADPETVIDFLEGSEDDEQEGEPEGRPETDLDKAWHGLHFLLTGTAWEGGELGFLVTGGEPIGDVDVGYGPARAFRKAQVAGIRAAVDAVSVEALRARFDPAQMKRLEIYPDIWDRPEDQDDTLGYLLQNRGSLLNFLDCAVRDGLGMLVVCT